MGSIVGGGGHINLNSVSRMVTAADVAKAAKVSRSAVSRAFTPSASINPTTRQEILAVAAKLGYRPNALARTLVKSKQVRHSGIIAVVMGEFDNPFQSHIFGFLTQALQQRGRVAMLVMADREGGSESAVDRLIAYQVDGAIIAAGSLSPQITEQFLRLNIPMVLLGREDPDGKVPAILTDNYAVGQRVAQHFISQKRTRLGFVSGRLDGQASRERQRGFIDTVVKAGYGAPLCIANSDYSYQSGFDAGLSLMAQQPDMDGIFCACDALAFGAMDALRLVLHRSVPQDVSIVGCDDVPQASWSGYELTTVAQPTVKLVEQAMETLWQAMEKKSGVSSSIRLPPTFVQRRT